MKKSKISMVCQYCLTYLPSGCNACFLYPMTICFLIRITHIGDPENQVKLDNSWIHYLVRGCSHPKKPREVLEKGIY